MLCFIAGNWREKRSVVHNGLNPALRLSTFGWPWINVRRALCILIIWLLSVLLNQQVVSEYTQPLLQLWNGIRCATHSTCYYWEKQSIKFWENTVSSESIYMTNYHLSKVSASIVVIMMATWVFFFFVWAIILTIWTILDLQAGFYVVTSVQAHVGT